MGAVGGRDKNAKLLVTGGTVALRFRRLSEAWALPLAPLGRASGLNTAPPPARRGSFWELESPRGLPPGHVREGGCRDDVVREPLALRSYQPLRLPLSYKRAQIASHTA